MENRHVPPISCQFCGAIKAKPHSYYAAYCATCGEALCNFERMHLSDFKMWQPLFAAKMLESLNKRKMLGRNINKCRAYRKDGYQCAAFAVDTRHGFPVCKSHKAAKCFEAVL